MFELCVIIITFYGILYTLNYIIPSVIFDEKYCLIKNVIIFFDVAKTK